MTAILFVCLGNICRSPLAEGVFRHQAHKAGLDHLFEIDSAGCGGWHAGDPPDKRSIAIAAKHGVVIHEQQARQIRPEDFDRFDLILGLDRDNVAHLTAMQPKGAKALVALYLEEALDVRKDVPDPYYGPPRDFEEVFKLCEKASAALLNRLVSG